MSVPKIAFEMERIRLSLDKLLPVRIVREPETNVSRYLSIVSSIPQVGIIEPLMVYPNKGNIGTYFLMDGHLRHHALKALGITEVECIVSTEDESFTYNARISRLAPIQEHSMIAKAVENGVSVERIAEALNLNLSEVRARLNLLKGIHEEAVDLLKDKQIAPAALRVLRRVTAVRQIEIAEIMVSANNYTKGYAEALLMGTSRDQLVDPGKPKTTANISAEEIARMEQEMESLERDFKAIEESYSENMLNLTVIRGFVKKLIDNAKVVRFLSSRHGDLFTEFERIAATETL